MASVVFIARFRMAWMRWEMCQYNERKVTLVNRLVNRQPHVNLTHVRGRTVPG
jgi:hypothetical protein